MQWVLLTAFGVGLATVAGAALGFLFGELPHRLNDSILSFAAGVMLCAAIVGLIMPSLGFGGKFAPLITCVSIMAGAAFLNLIDKVVPHMHHLFGVDKERHNNKSLDKTLLFVLAIAIHNFPEGAAAGVAFGTGDTGAALTVALGIALQNIPEGLVTITPLIAAGFSKKKAFLIALVTGMIEVVGTIFGYFAINIAQVILPAALAFAGGTMLYVVSDEMIPETHSHGYERLATYSLLIGFSVMLALDFFL